MVSARICIIGALVTMKHAPTTHLPLTQMTLHCVETPGCGEGFLVTHTVVEHCSDPAGDVQEQFKHVLKFGILIHLEFKTPNISPGPDALTAQIRCLVNDLLATPLSISGFITTCFLAINCLLIVKEAGLILILRIQTTGIRTTAGPHAWFQRTTAWPAPTPPTSPVPCPECAYILTSGVMAILSASLLRTRCLRTAGRNITGRRL